MRESDIRLLMEISKDNMLLPGWQRGVERQRAKTTRAGDLLYVKSYPIWDTSTDRYARKQLEKAREKKGTTDAQKRLNARKAEERLVMLINANFSAGDLLVTCTYDQAREPEDLKAATRNMRNYLARIRRMCKRKGAAPPEYVYVTETTHSRRWGTRYHHHMVLKADLTRAEAESLWDKSTGAICNTRTAKRLKEGLTGWAKYLAKQVCSQSTEDLREVENSKTHRWAASKGLTVPEPTTADKKISRRRVESMAREIKRDPETAKLHLAACYPGYEVLELNVRTSAWVSGAYVDAILVKEERPHPSSCFAGIHLPHGGEGNLLRRGGTLGRG